MLPANLCGLWVFRRHTYGYTTTAGTMGDGDAAEIVVSICLLGIAQDGGRPQPGCQKECCTGLASIAENKRHPVSLGIIGSDGSGHLFEATRDLAWQLQLWGKCTGISPQINSLWITHAHHGHIDGLGLFGKTAMDVRDLPLYTSPSFFRLMKNTPHWFEMLRRGVFSSKPFESAKEYSPLSIQSEREVGFSVMPLKIPHRDELSDTHAMIIKGPNKTLLFLPDHDTWEETLTLHGQDSIRELLNKYEIDIALIDGTFWSSIELTGRSQAKVPHPPVSQTLEMVGQRMEGDPLIYFIHLNHTNPLHNENSPEYQKVIEMGWNIGFEGMVINL